MLLNSLCVIAGLIGFIITAILLNNHKSNPIMNIYMVLLMSVISCRFFLFGIINLISNPEILTTYTKYSNLSALVIPISYLYFENLAQKKQSFNRTELLHFIFPVCYFIITSQTYTYSPPGFLVKLLFFLVFSVYLIIYLYWSYATLKNTIWSKSAESKIIRKQNNKIHHWTLFLFIALLLASIRLLISLFIEVSHNGTTRGLSYQWISSLIWIAILIKILATPEILYGYKLLDEKLKENRNSHLVFNEIWLMQPVVEINNSQHFILKEKIDDNLQNYFEAIEKGALQYDFFRDSKLTLTDLATKLGIPKSHLSYLFKYHATISFSEYKKIIRIQDAVKLIENGYLKNNTLDSLSKKIGFTSYNPFFTSFKEIIGIAPAEYINKIHTLI